VIWRGKRWAWVLALILSVLGILISAILLTVSYTEIISIINAAILYYITRPGIRRFFAKGRSETSAMSPQQPPTQ